jgi:DNA helicase-2/ATP-dependent DNA helicase PcrA
MASTDSLGSLVARLSADQRRAATAPTGPVLCVAPAGSGKTTTLVARIAWRLAGGLDPTEATVVTFNRRAAEELTDRIGAALAGITTDPAAVRVRTFHALGREILIDAGLPVEPLVDRGALLRTTFPGRPAAELRRLDDVISRLKLDAMVTLADVSTDPDPGPSARAFAAYEQALARTGGLDFDDLVARALGALGADRTLLERWRGRCRELFVDEVQDVDRSQLALAFILAAPDNRIFLVGDDDQTIYGWRLADVRRILGLAADLPGVVRVDLVTNRRCPTVVVRRAARLVSRNAERFAKEIRSLPGAEGRLVLAPDSRDEAARIARVLRSWPDDGGTRAILARTKRELLPAMAVALQAEIPFRSVALASPLESSQVERILTAAATTDPSMPLLARLARARWIHRPDASPDTDHASCNGAPSGANEPLDQLDPGGGPSQVDVAAALLGWAPGYSDLASFAAAIDEARRRLAALRRDDAPLTLATAHATKGLEFDHVAVVGMDAGRFPSGRSLAEATDRRRALEEERRLAYVAWTRARRSLTLVYDPASPSPFLLEAFDPDELGLVEAA